MKQYYPRRSWKELSRVLLMFGFLWITMMSIAQDSEQTVLGTVSVDAPEAQFTINANAEQIVNVEVISVSGGLALQFIITDSDGTLVLAVGNAELLATVTGEFMLLPDELYTVTVVSANNTAGDFVLRVYGDVTLSESLGAIDIPEEVAPVSCSLLVDQAVQSVGTACSGTGRNQACYGNNQVEVAPKEGAGSVVFAVPGDLIDVVDMEYLTLSPLDIGNAIWGVALLKVQANIPDTLPGQNVTVLVMGDVEIKNAGGDAALATMPVVALSNVNIRSGPATGYAVSGVLGTGDVIQADGQLFDGSWVRVQLDDGAKGWVYSTFLAADTGYALADLAVVSSETEDNIVGPMQAFYFTSGIGEPECEEVPQDGIMIQTPSGVGQISMQINDVNIQVGSTVVLRAQPGGMMTIATLEGSAEVEAMGQTQVAIEGMQVLVPLSQELKPAGPPEPPEPLDLAKLHGLPLELLPEIVVIPEPVEGIVLPTLPTSGLCVLATASAVPVNLRSGPSIDFAVVGSLDPTQIYDVVGRTGESDWYQTGAGWAASFVTRQGGNCSGVPITYMPSTPTPMPTETPEPNAFTPARDTEWPGVDVDYQGNPVTVTGEISFPEGDRQDTIIYYWVNMPPEPGRVFTASFLCAGANDFSYILLPDGASVPCNGNGYTYQVKPGRGLPNNHSFTIQMVGGSNAFVIWSATFSFVDY